MKRIRLLQLVHGYPPAVGGVEYAVRDMCERLVSDHGFDVTVLTTDAFTVASFQDASQPTIPIDPDEVQQGVRVLRFPVRTTPSRLLKQPMRVADKLRLPGNDWLRTWYNGPISPQMLRVVRGFDADAHLRRVVPLERRAVPVPPSGPEHARGADAVGPHRRRLGLRPAEPPAARRPGRTPPSRVPSTNGSG